MNFRKLGCTLLIIPTLSSLLVQPVEAQSSGDVVIVGNDARKQAELQRFWNFRRNGIFTPSVVNQNVEVESSVSTLLDEPNVDIRYADSRTKIYCKRERRNERSNYEKYNECLKEQLQAKYKFENDPEIKKEIKSSDKRKCSTEVIIIGSTPEEVNASWKYRYQCVKSEIASRIRERDYMK